MPVADKSEFQRGSKKGPALYIVTSGLLGAMFGVSFLMRYNPIGFAFVFAGCMIGALLYRVRSRHWPVDTTARSRQVRYILAVMTLIPGTIFVFSGIKAHGAAMVMIGVIAGLAITCGIIVSGTRRHRNAS